MGMIFMLSRFSLPLFIFNFALWANIEFKKLNVALPSPFVKDMLIAGDFLYVATAGGIAQIQLKNYSVSKIFNRSSGLPENYVTCLQTTPDGKYLYAGTPSGLAKIDLETSQVTIFNRQKKQLSDDRVNTVYVEEDFILVGTALGVDRYDIKLNRWVSYTAIEGLAGNNIQALAGDLEFLWAGGADGLSFYDKNDDFWDSYTAAQGLNSNLITAVIADADAIWVGTAGGGVSRFDRSSQRFENLTSEFGLIDDNVQALIDDGKYLWIATFDGLSLLDKTSLKFANYHSQNGFTETSLTAGVVYGNKIYLGSDGGIYIATKNFPQVSLSPKNIRYTSKGEISVIGTVQSEWGIESYELSYQNLDQAQKEWQKEGVVLTGKTGKDIIIAKIDTKRLKEGRYLARLEAKDKKNQSNLSFAYFFVDHTPPKIELMFRQPKPTEKETMVTGRYEEAHLKELEVAIGNKKVPVNVDKQQKRFRFSYPLFSGEKIKVIASDLAMNQNEIVRDFVVDNDPPKLTVEPIDGTSLNSNQVTIRGTVEDKNLDQVIVNPGQILAKVTPLSLEKYEFSAETTIKKEGTYTFKITAFDKAGRSTTVSLPVKFFSDVTIVEIDDEKIPSFTLKPEVEFSGNILGPLLKEFYIEPGKINIPVKSDKSFSIKLPLKAGKNVFTLVAIHDRTGEKVEQTFEIESGNKEVDAYLDIASRSFSQKLVTLRGKFDRGISRILVNKKNAQMDMKQLEYFVELELKDGANNIQITTVDELGRTKTKTETVYLDREAPVIEIKKPPAMTSLTQIPLRGRVKDISSFEIEVFPSAYLNFLSREDGNFEATLFLKQGINRFTLIAKDLAGNQSQVEFSINQDPSFAALSEDPSANFSQEIEALRKEIEELKKKKGISYISQGISVKKLPSPPGLYFVPTPGKTNSLELAAKLYLGNEAFSPLLASYNQNSFTKEVIIPNMAFLHFLQETSFRRDYDPLLRHITKNYVRGKNILYLEKDILSFLLRRRILQQVLPKKSYTIFALKDGRAIVLSSQSVSQNNLKSLGYREILLLTANRTGISLALLP